MLHEQVSAALRLVGGRPCFRIYGRAAYEPRWHVIDVIATSRRDLYSPWPLLRGSCTTWTANVIAVGTEFANRVLLAQQREPASRDRPVIVRAGRLRSGMPTASEILAHECGHTGQARRMGVWYWPLGATFTLFREGDRWWNRFENEASATGQFGGLVNST